MTDQPKTEQDFLQEVFRVCQAHGIPRDRQGMVEMWAEENASDIDNVADKWTVAIATLAEAVDQGLLIRVSQVGSAY